MINLCFIVETIGSTCVFYVEQECCDHVFAPEELYVICIQLKVVNEHEGFSWSSMQKRPLFHFKVLKRGVSRMKGNKLHKCFFFVKIKFFSRHTL